MQRKIELPFDGTGKTPMEAAQLIEEELKNFVEEEVKFFVPMFWSWREHWRVLMNTLISILKHRNSNFNFVQDRDEQSGELSILVKRIS